MIDGFLNFFTDLWTRIDTALLAKDRYLVYLDGLRYTIEISFYAVIIGVLIGILVAVGNYMADNSKKFRWLKIIFGCYVQVVRGTPVVLQLLIIYNFIFANLAEPVWAAVLAFGLNSGAYVSEIIRGGINSIDKGQMEAGRSLGFGRWQTMKLIILPQAIKNIIPALGNEFVVLIKETSIAGIIAVTDITKAAQYIGNSTYDILTPLCITAVAYLIMVLALSRLIAYVERRLSQGDRS